MTVWKWKWEIAWFFKASLCENSYKFHFNFFISIWGCCTSKISSSWTDLLKMSMSMSKGGYIIKKLFYFKIQKGKNMSHFHFNTFIWTLLKDNMHVKCNVLFKNIKSTSIALGSTSRKRKNRLQLNEHQLLFKPDLYVYDFILLC